MVSKAGLFFLLVVIPFSGLAQVQDSEIRVFDEDSEISLPDSIQMQFNRSSTSPENMLLQWLSADGYLNATIDSVHQNTVYLKRNCAFEIKELTWNYSGQKDTVLSENPGIRYTQQNLTGEIESRLFELSEEGFPFASAEIIRFNPEDGNCSVSVEINVDTGENAEASQIYFTGLESNSQDYLRKISRFRAGQTITPNYLRFLQGNLNSSELFNFVGDGQILLREGKPVIVFEVQERSLNQFDGLLGYVPDVTGNGRIVGDVELSLWNVLNQGNGLNFRYERLRPETSELNLGVSQDWIGDIPVGLSAGFELYQNDTTYQSRQFELGSYYRISGGFRLTGGLEFQSSTSGSNIPAIVEPDGRKRTARLGFDYSNVDNFNVPTAGNRISVSYGIANKNLQEDSTGTFIQNYLEVEASQYIPIFAQSVLAISVDGFLLEADKVTINDLIRFGGANSFRGYSEDQLRAGRLLWGDLEYRFLLDRNSYVFAFGAVGSYHRPKLLTETNNNFQVNNNLYSTGFGLSYQTQIGRLKFSYAISPEESIANGKVHFGIKTEL